MKNTRSLGRTTDDDGYQIANDLGRSVYTNQDANYYNSQGDLSPEYLDMKSVKTGSRSLNNLDQTNKQKATNKTKVRAAVPDLKSSKVPVEERQDAWTGDLYELAGEGVYDNMEDEHEQSKVQSSVCDRDKSGTSSKRRSSSNLKRRDGTSKTCTKTEREWPAKSTKSTRLTGEK